MNVAVVRVDSRLVHGQVVETWLPALRIQAVLVVDAQTATSPLAQAAMRLALPPEIALTVAALEDVDWAAVQGSEARTLVLVRTVPDLLRVHQALDLAKNHVTVNVGVVNHSDDRRPIIPGVHLSSTEIDTLSGLAEHGVEVEVRSLPSQTPLPMSDVRARFSRMG